MRNEHYPNVHKYKKKNETLNSQPNPHTQTNSNNLVSHILQFNSYFRSDFLATRNMIVHEQALNFPEHYTKLRIHTH